MKKTLLAVMAVLMMSVMLIAGCSSGEEAAPAADKKSGTTTIGFSISTLNNPFFVSVKDGVEAKAKELGVNVKLLMPRTTRQNRLTTLQTCSSRA